MQRQREKETEKRGKGEKKRESGKARERGTGIAPKNGMVEQPSRQVVGTGPRRGETGEQSHYRGEGGERTLPNPISMSPVTLFSPARLRLPEPSRPARFELSFSLPLTPSVSLSISLRTPPVSNPRSTTTRGPTWSSHHRSISPSSVSHPTALLPAIRGRIERSMGLADYQSSATFKWPIVGNFGFPDGNDFTNFPSLRARRMQLAFTYDFLAFELNCCEIARKLCNLKCDLDFQFDLIF